MRWPFRRGRPSGHRAPHGVTRPSAVPPDVVAPRAPGNAWAHAEPLTAPTATPPLTFRGDRFGRSVIGARAMATPPIPPLHHRADAGAPAGILLDVVTSPVVVAAMRVDVGSRSSVAGLPPLTHRHLHPAPPVPTAELLRSDLQATYTSFRPGRADETPTVLGEMSWDAEHGFRQSAPSAALRMVRRRCPAGPLLESSPDSPPSIDDGRDGADDATTAASAGPAALRYVPAAGSRYERPPSDLVDVVRQATGVDVANATIDRSAQTSVRAAAIGAVAFTEGTTVHLPIELGPYDEGTTRAVLAHELTHVAQQRSAGGPMPSETSPDGLELEHQARAVQRTVDDRAPVIPIFLRTVPAVAGAPSGVQRLAADDERFDWQQRGAPPSQRGARSAFGFGFLRVDPDSADGRAEDAADQEWAEEFERDRAADLQRIRDERYAEMVEEAERELQIQNLREERTGEDVLELERRDIFALRRRLDDEMPWEFGPPPSLDHLYPTVPPLPDEIEPTRTSPVVPADVTATRPAPSPVVRTIDEPPPEPSIIGQDSALRRSTPTTLRHPHGGVRGPGVSTSEPDVSWQERPPTSRERLGAVFGGNLGALLATSVSDGDDEAQRRQAEEDPDLMRRRQEREQELRHLELRTRSMAARREDRSGEVVLDSEAIALIRTAVDDEMPLEFVMPEYLDRGIDAAIDADGNIVDLDDVPNVDAPTGDTEPDDADVDPITARSTAGESGSAGLEAITPPTAPPTASSTGGRAGAGAGGDSAATGAALSVGTLSTEGPSTEGPSAERRSTEDDPSDEQDLATRVFESASDLDLDALARRLYGRFRRDLRRELLIDRERAGTLADAC